MKNQEKPPETHPKPSKWKQKIKKLIIPIIIGLSLAFTYETIAPKYYLLAFIIGILIVAGIRYYQFKEYIKLLFEFGETVMYGRPRKKEYWKDEAEFIKARNLFWKRLGMGLYWKFYGKHKYALIQWWKWRSFMKTNKNLVNALKKCQNDTKEINPHFNVLKYHPPNIQEWLNNKEVP